jgi:hypothetical protein
VIGNLPALDGIEQRVFLFCGHRVMRSTDLAQLYAVEPRARMQSVKRNWDRFPANCMFRLTTHEFDRLKSQIVISSWGGLRRAGPYAFTEQGAIRLPIPTDRMQGVTRSVGPPEPLEPTGPISVYT